MRKRIVRVGLAFALTAGVVVMSAAPSGAAPTCSHLGIANHGEHIVGDYVTGLGGALPPQSLEWPPKGQVGAAIAGEGALHPGAPGPHQHPFAPGASFCTDSASPGPHLLP
jgi:hypothetical protein